MIELENKKLHDLLLAKDSLVKDGRKISSELETIQFKITKLQDKEKKITEKVAPKELMEKIELKKLAFEKALKEFDETATELHNVKLEAVPKDMKDEHLILMKKRSDMEAERNKIALKIQKYKDKMIPLLKKLIKPYLKEYDDTESVEIKGGKILVKTFNYLEDYKAKFKKK